MKKAFFYYLLIISFIEPISAQCDFIKILNRPDGNVIRYFNPQPITNQSDYEVGLSIYKNMTSNVLMLGILVVFKTETPKKLSKTVIIQTTNNKGIELEPLVSESMVLNERDVSLGIYKIEKVDFEQLKKYPLKSVFFYLEGNLKGFTVTKNKTLLNSELRCF